jgi:hypothetical protein
MRVKVQYKSACKETFKRFKESNPDVKITYALWSSIIYNFNYAFRDMLFETGNKCKLPYGFGEFAIMKYRPKKFIIGQDGGEHINLPVDWAKSRIAGKRVYHMNYHTEGFTFRLKWFIATARFQKSILWSFKPSRVTSRLITHYISQGYQEKYLEWKK